MILSITLRRVLGALRDSMGTWVKETTTCQNEWLGQRSGEPLDVKGKVGAGSQVHKEAIPFGKPK